MKVQRDTGTGVIRREGESMLVFRLRALLALLSLRVGRCSQRPPAKLR